MDQTSICLSKLVFYCLVSELLVRIFSINQNSSFVVYVECENPRLLTICSTFILLFLFSTQEKKQIKRNCKKRQKNSSIMDILLTFVWQIQEFTSNPVSRWMTCKTLLTVLVFCATYNVYWTPKSQEIYLADLP